MLNSPSHPILQTLLWSTLVVGTLSAQVKPQEFIGQPTALDLADRSELALRKHASQLRLQIERELHRQRAERHTARAERLERYLQEIYRQYHTGHWQDAPATNLHLVTVVHGRRSEFWNASDDPTTVIGWQDLGLNLWHQLPPNDGLTNQQLIREIAGTDHFETVRLEVGPSSKPAYLYLAGAHALHWQIRVHPQAKLQGVFLSGFVEQKISGLPEDIPVQSDIGSADSDIWLVQKLFFPQYNDDSNPQDQIQRQVGLRVTTKQSFDLAPARPIQIGSVTQEQQLASLVRALEKLKPIVERLTHLEIPDELKQIGFEYIEYRTTATEDIDTSRMLVPIHQARVRKCSGLELEPQPTTDWMEDFYSLTENPRLQKRYAVKRYSDHILTFVPDVPPVYYRTKRGESLNALAWDTQRDRLIGLSSLNQLVHCEPSFTRYTKLAAVEEELFCDLQYDRSSDELCALVSSAVAPKVVFFDAATGKQKSKLVLRRLPSNSLWRLDSPRQLRATQQHLILLITDTRTTMLEDRVLPTWAYVFERSSGNLDWKGRLSQSNHQSALSYLQIAKLWNSLPATSGDKRDAICEQLLASQTTVVPFLKHQFPPLPKCIPAEVTSLVEQLDDESFLVRENALAQLARLGTQVQEQLQTAFLSTTSVEARTRLRQLLREIRTSYSSSPQMQQELLAVELLGQFRSTEAIKFLEDLSSTHPNSVRANTARHALQLLEQRQGELSRSELQAVSSGSGQAYR